MSTKRTYAFFAVVLVVSNTFTWWINIHAPTTIKMAPAAISGSGWFQEQQQQSSQAGQQKGHIGSFESNQSINFLTTAASFTVDILSVGSMKQIDLIQAQQQTFGSHKSVRNFFNVTEVDDADPNCHTDITWDHVKEISDYCTEKRRHYWKRLSPIYKSLLGEYAKVSWLKKKGNPVGWMCAQPRPYAGLRKAFMHYRQTGEALPNYFIIMDDDTYYDIDWFQTTMEALGDSSYYTCYAGCRIRYPINQFNFTLPYGGYGTILGNDVLRKMSQGIHCPVGYFDDRSDGNARTNLAEVSGLDAQVCQRLKENNVYELQYFSNGMNLIDLMYKYTTAAMYRNVSQWLSKGKEGRGDGFCMHSDWVIGYFINYYNISRHVEDPFYKDVPQSRIEALQESEIYGGRKSGFCRQDGIGKDDMKLCEHGSKICHRVSPDWMKLAFMHST